MPKADEWALTVARPLTRPSATLSSFREARDSPQSSGQTSNLLRERSRIRAVEQFQASILRCSKHVEEGLARVLCLNHAGAPSSAFGTLYVGEEDRGEAVGTQGREPVEKKGSPPSSPRPKSI